MTGQEELDLLVDYLVSTKTPSYLLACETGEGLSAEQLRSKAERELNDMTRCEYIRTMCGDDIRMFSEKRKLARGEIVTKTYIVTMPEIPTTEPTGE